MAARETARAKGSNVDAEIDAAQVMDDVMQEEQQEKGESCGREIRKLETPRLWQGHVVCIDCIERLSKPR